MTIHWCGTGLSAIPGLRRLLDAGHDVAVCNRTPEKAREAVGDLTSNIHAFSIANLGQMLSPKDVIVSMLPGDWHVELAELAIAHGAHFVSSSYIAPDMRALDQKAKDAGVCLINEVGHGVGSFLEFRRYLTRGMPFGQMLGRLPQARQTCAANYARLWWATSR